MKLSREVEDPLIGAGPQPQFAGFELACVADALVGSKHRRVAILERLGDTLAHHADAIDSVDESLR